MRVFAGGRAVAGAAAIAVAGVFAAACSTTADSATGSKGYVSGDGAITTIAAADRQPAPRLSGETLEGGSVSLADHAGSVVVLNVWASWCGPCRAEAADLVKASTQAEDAVFIGINTRDDPSAAEAFVRARRIPYESIVDRDGQRLLAFYGLVNPKALPTTLVIDAAGRIAALVNGPVTAITLLDLIADVAGEA